MIARDVFLRGLEMIHSASMLTVPEATFLYEFAASFDRPITWVELGVWCGRGYWSAGCGLPDDSILVGVDTFDGKLPEREGSENIVQFCGPKLVRKMAQAVRWELMQSTHLKDVRTLTLAAHDAAAVWSDGVMAGQLPLPIDVLVIDAAHDYESVKQDLADWLPKLRPGGTVLCHDYTSKNRGVVEAVDEVACNGDSYRNLSRVRGTRFAMIELYEQATV